MVFSADGRVASPIASLRIGELLITARYLDVDHNVLAEITVPTIPSVANLALKPSSLYYNTALKAPMSFSVLSVDGAVIRSPGHCDFQKYQHDGPQCRRADW